MTEQSSYINKVIRLLFPQVWSIQDRKGLLMEAFFTSHRWVLGHIEIDGPADVFSANCLETLLAQDCYLVENLLMALHRVSGEQERTEIQRLLAELPELCRMVAATQARPPSGEHSQSDGRPALYLSYTDEDQSFVERLQADLSHYGHVCRTGQVVHKGGEAWLAATAEGLNNAYAVIVVVGRQTYQDRWVQVELLGARDKRKQIFPVLLENGLLPAALPAGINPVLFHKTYEAGLNDLIQQLPNPPAAATVEPWLPLSPELVERAAELTYMDRLKLAELQHVAQYTRLSGQAEIRRTRGDKLALQPVVARPEFTLMPWRPAGETPVERRSFEDAVTELAAIRRAVLLGEPGAGKTTTLYKLAADLVDAALLDRTAPIPLMIRLGSWTEAGEPFPSFLRRSAGELGDRLDHYLATGRAALLLDGLNEIPAGQQADKYRKIRQFLARFPRLMTIVSCREQDYPPERDLALDKVMVAPLDPVRVYEFVCNYLDHTPDSTAGEQFFWRLAGVAAGQSYKRFLAEMAEKVQEPFAVFWLARELPDGVKWGADNWSWQRWRKERDYPASLLRLAYNPYMLFMLVDVYESHKRTLPANRGQLFDWFVETLLVRERLLGRDGRTGAVLPKPAGTALLAALTDLAYKMQTRRGETGAGDSALTVLTPAAAFDYLNQHQLYQAASANLLVWGEEVRFAHQLLQEYFAARAMRERIFARDKKLDAAEIWPPQRWWEPTNWEEATILLAGLYSDDCTPVLEWVAEANPELAARSIAESGAYTPEETKNGLWELWLPRLTEDPASQARAAVGRAMGLVTLAGGAPLDNRPGIGILVRQGLRVPDIAWGKTVPAGEYTVGGDEKAYNSFDKKQVPITRPFQLSRYPVTYAQFQCFVDAPDFGDPRWWADMAVEGEAYGTVFRLRELGEQAFKYWNHPRERVSWYQAVAFCRWLSDKLGLEVDLPHEYEWEAAARYPDGRHYPWGDKFDPAKANTSEGNIGRTTAAGVYLSGKNPTLELYDLGGNVWEWCRNKFSRPEDDRVDDSGDGRVVRGGSWSNPQNFARAASHYSGSPAYRYDGIGFRVVRRPPSHGH